MKPAANRAPIFATPAEARHFLAANATAMVGLACVGISALMQRQPPKPVAYILGSAGLLFLVVPLVYLHYQFRAVAKRLKISLGAAHWLSRNPATWREAFRMAKREPQH